MNDSTKLWLYRIAVFAGYLSFFMHTKKLHPLLIISTATLLPTIFVDWRHKKSYIRLLMPFSSGLLCFLMKQFYWDRFDFAFRVHGLILLSLLSAFILTIREFDLVKRFLIFFNGLELKKRLLAIFIFTEILFIISAGLLVKKGVVLGGDEPHYLAISQSVIKDFDLNVFNQYFREGYKEFIKVKQLRAHGAFGKGYKKMYSIHLPGAAVTVAPFLLLKIPLPYLYFLIRACLGFFGALLAVVVYLFSFKLWENKNLSLFVTAVFCLTVPVFFHSFHIFPELQALLLILSSLYFLFFPGKKKNLKTLLAGLLLGVTVFWGLKYIIFIYLFSLGFFFFFFVKKRERKRAVLFILFPLLFQVLFFYYLYFAYGNFSPMSVYTGMMTESQAEEYYSKAAAIPFRNRVETLLNYLFDQRDGLLLYSPFYFFAFPGLLIALRKFKTYLPHLLVSLPAFIYILYHGYSTVRPGYCPQARYLVPVMWLFLLFAIIYYRERLATDETKQKFFGGSRGAILQKSPPGRRRQNKSNYVIGLNKKIFFLLPVYSFFVVVYQVLHPFTLYQPTTHDSLHRPGLMFSQWSNLHINIPDFLPSFIKVPGNFSYLPNLVFLTLFVLLIILALINKKSSDDDRSGGERSGSGDLKQASGAGTFSPRVSGNGAKNIRLFFILLFMLLFSIFILFPKVPLYNATLVQKKGVIPYKIYRESKRPGIKSEKKINISGKDRGRYTISTLNKVKYFVFEIKNNKESEVKISIYNYDKPAGEEVLQPLQEGKIYLTAPLFRRFKNKFFYQFTLFFNSAGTKPNSLDLHIYPVNEIET